MLIMYKVLIDDEQENYGEISDDIELAEVCHVVYKCGMAVFNKTAIDEEENIADYVIIPMDKTKYREMCKILFAEGKVDLTDYNACDFKFFEEYTDIAREEETGKIRKNIIELLERSRGIVAQ